MIFVKDEDGLYDKDPKKHADAKLIKNISLDALLADLPEELILDRELFLAWRAARHIKQICIVNGLKPQELAKALAGEPAGTTITKEG